MSLVGKDKRGREIHQFLMSKTGELVTKIGKLNNHKVFEKEKKKLVIWEQPSELTFIRVKSLPRHKSASWVDRKWKVRKGGVGKLHVCYTAVAYTVEGAVKKAMGLLDSFISRGFVLYTMLPESRGDIMEVNDAEAILNGRMKGVFCVIVWGSLIKTKDKKGTKNE